MHTHRTQPNQDAAQNPQNAVQLQAENAHQSPQGKKEAIQAKQRPVQRMQGYQAHQAKHQPVQRKTPPNDLKTQMGNQYGVDLSGFQEHQNSSFPGSVNALATIQGKDIHYAPGQYTTQNRKHELGHAIDNTLNGTPKGDKVVNGQSVDTTREKAADKIAETPLQRKATDETLAQAPAELSQTVQRQEDNLLDWLIAGGVLVAAMFVGYIIILTEGKKKKISVDDANKVQNDGGSNVANRIVEKAEEVEESKEADNNGKKEQPAPTKVKKKKWVDPEKARRETLLKEFNRLQDGTFKAKCKEYEIEKKTIEKALSSGYKLSELQNLAGFIAETQKSRKTSGTADDLQEGINAMIKIEEAIDNTLTLAEEICEEAEKRLDQAFEAYQETNFPFMKRGSKDTDRREVRGNYIKEVAEHFGIPGWRRPIHTYYQDRLTESRDADAAKRLAKYRAEKAEQKAEEEKKKAPATLASLNNKPYNEKIPPTVKRWANLKEHYLTGNHVNAVCSASGNTEPMHKDQYIGPRIVPDADKKLYFNFGHKQGFENRRFIRAYSCGYINRSGYTRSQLANPRIYQMERIDFNESGRGEDEGNDITREIYDYLNSIGVWRGPNLGK